MTRSPERPGNKKDRKKNRIPSSVFHLHIFYMFARAQQTIAASSLKTFITKEAEFEFKLHKSLAGTC
jgi:hypothetical protein